MFFVRGTFGGGFSGGSGGFSSMTMMGLTLAFPIGKMPASDKVESSHCSLPISSR
jgi:hypothetical protein